MFNAKHFLQTVTSRPGVYCMRDKANKVLYVGKAKNLKKRLTSYFRIIQDQRLQQMVGKIAHIDVTVTPSEKEALLLENSLIKSLNPRYNVIFKDDKSYPYLFISKHEFPRLIYFRGKQKAQGKYYGPYPSALAVRGTLILLQKLFKLRQCDDIFFSHRSRPCLQYQIKRCSAPCVDYITAEEYSKNVENVNLFLEGKNTEIIENLIGQMEDASQNNAFEQAAILRDEIIQLRSIVERQIVYKHKGNADVIAVAGLKGTFCIQLLYIRQGKILDTQTYFPKQSGEGFLAKILRSFLIQFYLDNEEKLDYPNEIIINMPIEDAPLIAQSLTQGKRRVKILHPSHGEKAQWMLLAQENAIRTVERKVSQLHMSQDRWVELTKVLGFTQNLTRIECFDVSHTLGEATVASCVVFDQTGAMKSEYRRYNLEVTPGDDYAAMEQVLTKRYLKRKDQELPMPEIVMIDGGKGQLHRAKKALLECQILEGLILAIAKGQGRKPGLETLYLTRMQSDEELMVKLPPTSGALHLLQQIRDEAHRFAILGHRRKRAKARVTSPLENIPGIGAKRRQKLLNFFGGQQALMAASQNAIAKVPGISLDLATRIYLALHGE